MAAEANTQAYGNANPCCHRFVKKNPGGVDRRLAYIQPHKNYCKFHLLPLPSCASEELLLLEPLPATIMANVTFKRCFSRSPQLSLNNLFAIKKHEWIKFLTTAICSCLIIPEKKPPQFASWQAKKKKMIMTFDLKAQSASISFAINFEGCTGLSLYFSST